mmetsp:Transcript_26047/g.65627  ORF Transcript_26047/g.65627 Transcript_26047/m.65627 type:complete len:506 (-) Transcript_26047:60-1577(-)
MAAVDLSPFTSILARLESVAERLEHGASLASGGGGGYPAAGSGGGAGAEDCPLALSFDASLKPKVAAAEAAAKDSGIEDIVQATEVFTKTMAMLRDGIAATGKCAKPKDADWQDILAPVVQLNQDAKKSFDKRNEYFDHRTITVTLCNICAMLAQMAPKTHVQSVLEEMDFHGNKVLKKQNSVETAWVRSLKEVVKALAEWCDENCKMGLVWKNGGEEAKAYFKANPLGSGGGGGASAAAPKAAGKGTGKGGGPPPPKGGFKSPPPEGVLGDKGKASAPAPAAGGGMAAVFAGLQNFNTGGLKKVTDDMKCKNRKDEAPLEPKAKVAAPKASPSAGGWNKKGPRGPPKKVLERDVNWMIENYEGETVVLEEATMQQLVCIINCKNATVHIKSKVKNIGIDGCQKVNIVCQDVVSTVEFVNSENCKLYTQGKVNCISLDKCDGGELHLSEGSLQADILTSKSVGLNVLIPDPDDKDGQAIEIPIPAQFVTRVSGRTAKTEIFDING